MRSMSAFTRANVTLSSELDCGKPNNIRGGEAGEVALHYTRNKLIRRAYLALLLAAVMKGAHETL